MVHSKSARVIGFADNDPVFDRIREEADKRRRAIPRSLRS